MKSIEGDVVKLKGRENGSRMAFKKLVCLSSKSHRKRSPSPRISNPPDHQIAVFENQIPNEIKGTTTVRLVKDHDQPLGLTIAGGCDKFSLARVEHLRAGGLASRCDLLQGKWRLFIKY